MDFQLLWILASSHFVWCLTFLLLQINSFPFDVIHLIRSDNSKMDDVTSVSNSTSNSNMMYILDGLNVLSGFGPDILQQALEEVTCDVDVPITTSPETLHHHDVVQTLDMDIRFETRSVLTVLTHMHEPKGLWKTGVGVLNGNPKKAFNR